jgi:chromosome partitioning protein
MDKKMKTIAFNSTKGGTGKSTLSIIMLNALADAGYKCLAIDTDMINHSLSFYFNSEIPFQTIQEKNIFRVFTNTNTDIKESILPVKERIDLIHADVRLTAMRGIGTFKLLKKALVGLDYDYVIIDTAPTWDNIIINVLTASDILVVPVQQDVFNHQSAQYLFQELTGLDLDNLDIHVVMNQFEKPRSDNKGTYTNQLMELFTNDATLSEFINPTYISKSSVIKKYINGQHYRINSRVETKKQYDELVSLIKSITGVTIEGNI